MGHVYSLPQPINLSLQEMPVPTELPSPTSPAEDEAIFFRKFLMVHGIRWPEKSRSGYIYVYITSVRLIQISYLLGPVHQSCYMKIFQQIHEFLSIKDAAMKPALVEVKSCFRECMRYEFLIFCISAIHLQLLLLNACLFIYDN